jgi:hypothetical protein
MKKPKLQDFKREVYDGQDYADWYKEYYQALEKYVDELEQALRIHDVVGRSEQFYCTCSRAKGLDHDDEGMPYCIECQKSVQ